MTALTRNAALRATLWVLAINAVALIAFACAPVAQEYPLAVLGILAFLLVQAFLPACRIRVTAPVCPANIAQGLYWIQLVLITVLVGYFGFSQGALPHLPALYAQIVCPMLVLWAEHDKHFPVRHAERLHAVVPGSRLQVIPEAEHWMPWYLAEAVATQIRAFVT